MNYAAMNPYLATPKPSPTGTGTIGASPYMTDIPAGSTISQASNHLEAAQNELCALLNELESRLGPVLTPRDPQHNDKPCQPPYAAPLADWIEQRAMATDGAIELVRSLHARIQL